jgi:hypothetical protein
MGKFSCLVCERRLVLVELADQEQVDLLATVLAPIGQSVNGEKKYGCQSLIPVNSIKPLGEGRIQRLDNPSIHI